VKKRTLVAVLAGGLVLGLVVGYAVRHYFGSLAEKVPWKSGEQDDSAAVDGSAEVRSDVHGLGWLEPARGVIEVCTIPGNRVDITAEAKVGKRVKKGALLATLVSHDLLQKELASLDAQIQEASKQHLAEVNAADARIEAAESKRKDAEIQKSEKQSLQDRIGVLESQLRLYRAEQKQLETLSVRSEENRSGGQLSLPLVSKQEIERQKLVVEQAEAELKAAQAEEERMGKANQQASDALDAELNVLKAAKATIVASDPVPALKRAREIAELKLKETEVRAPITGTILKKFMESGELSTQKPILQMANLRRMVAVVEVYESDGKRIRPGQPVRIESDAFHEPHDRNGLTGKVVEIGQIFNTAETRSLDPYARGDRHAIPVRVAVDDAGTTEAAQFINLQVEAVFLNSK
jgi:HlyD family secretion protein